MEQAKYDVFISYARNDSEAAERVFHALTVVGINKVFYAKDLSLGMDFASTISNGIRDCESFILLLTENYLNSAWCRKELNEAIKRNKHIIPLRIGSIGTSIIPHFLNKYNIVDYHVFLANPQKLRQNIYSAKENDYQQSMTPPCLSAPRSYSSTPRMMGRKTWIRIGLLVLLALLCFIFCIIFNKKDSSLIDQEPSLTREVESHITYRSQQCDTKPNNVDENLSRGTRPHYAEIPDTQILEDSSRPPHSSSDISIINSYEDSETEMLQKAIENLEKENARLNNGFLVFLIASVVMLILFIIYYYKTKRLCAYLNIKSDAKAEAQIGEDTLLIEKGSEVSVQVPVGNQEMWLNYMSYNRPKYIKCFIGGSIELQTERDALRATISVVHNEWREKNFQIFSFTFEDFDKKFVEGGQQTLYDNFIENDANTAIFIIKGEVGEKTVKEFNKAYASFKTKGHPSIVVYHDKRSILGDTAKKLKQQVEVTGQYWNDYDTMIEMKYHFQELLSTDLWKLYEKELIANVK